MTMQTRGFGAARKPADKPCVPPYGISPQLAPPALSPSAKAVFAAAYVDSGREARAAKDPRK